MKRIAEMIAGVFVLGLVACSDGNKTTGVTEEDNAIADGGSSSSVAAGSCSSTDVLQSSSSVVASSSSAIIDPTDLWNATSGMYKVNTKSDESGYWYRWDDYAEGGNSTIVLPVSVGNEYSLDLLNPVIDFCSGLCSTIKFGNTSAPKVGVGFRVADEGQTADIFEWGGLCVTYSSDIGFSVGVSSEYDDEAYSHSMPVVFMPRSMGASAPVIDKFMDSSTVVTWCATWHDFFTYNREDPSDTLFGDVAAKKASAISFVFNGKSGEQATFNIKALGKYSTSGSCDLGFTSVPYIPKSSSSESVSSSSVAPASSGNFDDVCGFSELDDMWYGPSGETFVNTGFAKKENRGGTWFAFAVDSANVVFPKGTEPMNDDFSHVIDYCQGVCADITNWFGGVGFNIVGETADGSLEVADITEWGGLCVTYSSMYDLHVAFNDADHNDFSKVETLRYYTLSQTGGYARTSCELWSVLEAKTSTQLDPSKVSSIMFFALGGENFTGGFNILGLGKYHDVVETSQLKCSEPQRFNY